MAVYWATVILLAFGSLSVAQQQTIGTIGDRLLAPKAPLMTGPFAAAGVAALGRFRPALPSAAKVFVGAIQELDAAVVEQPDEPVQLYLDLDSSGDWTEDEAHELGPATNGRWSGEGVLMLPLEAGRFAGYPLRVVTYKEQSNPKTRLVGASRRAYLTGTISAGGGETLVWVELDRNSAQPKLVQGWVGVDVNHDGRIDASLDNREYAFAGERPPIFRVNNDYVSLESVDLAAGSITFKLESVEDYRLVEREPGTQTPDFSYVDFSGVERKLSDFEGKPVLLDFWASWCAPCVADTPLLKRLYADLQPRGFEILGINVDQEQDKAVAMIRDKQIPWTNATRESTVDLVKRLYRVRAFPTYILLDGDRKVVASGVRGEELDRVVREYVIRGNR